MPSRTPTEAYRSLLQPIQAALNSIAIGRLTLPSQPGRIQAGTILNTSFNDGVPTPLRAARAERLLIEVAFWARIEPILAEQYRYHCVQTAYWYTLSDGQGREIAAYHWTPDIRELDRRFPHLHIGNAVTNQSRFMPGSFHKLHLPTSRVTVQHLVRFAIQELGVAVRPGLQRDAVLDQLNRDIGDA